MIILISHVTYYVRFWTGVILAWPQCARVMLLTVVQGVPQGVCVYAQAHGKLEGTLVAFIIYSGCLHTFPKLRAFVESDVTYLYETFLPKK